MKTITSYLIAVVLSLLSGLVFYFATQTFVNAFTVYYNNTTGELQDLTIPLLVYGFIQLCASVYIALQAIHSFKMFLDFYSKYQHKKRDAIIKKTIEDTKYDTLFKDLQNTNIPSHMGDIVERFYEDKTPTRGRATVKGDLDDFLSQILKR